MYRLLNGRSMFNFLADFFGGEYGKHISLVKSRDEINIQYIQYERTQNYVVCYLIM